MSFLRRLRQTICQMSKSTYDIMQEIEEIDEKFVEIKASYLTVTQRLDLTDRRLEVIEHELNQLKDKD